MALLEIKNLDAHYGAIHALHGINLSVEAGQVVALLGANGAGKSTTLRAISGLLNVAMTGPGLVSGGRVLGVELAPTRIRTVAQGVTVAGGRLGAAISGLVFPLLFAGIGQSASYWVIAALAVLGAILTQVLGPETGRISLEAISEGAR